MPQMVSEIIVEDCQQPRAAVAVRRELMEKSVGTKNRVLKQVFGIIRISGEPKSRTIDRVQMWQRHRFEPLTRGRQIRWFGAIRHKPSIALTEPDAQGLINPRKMRTLSHSLSHLVCTKNAITSSSPAMLC